MSVQIPTISQITHDPIAVCASRHWLLRPDSRGDDDNGDVRFDPALVDQIYQNELLATRFSSKRLAVLELSQYLERFLWPHYNPNTASDQHVVSIAAMIVEKFRERLDAWTVLESGDDGKFTSFFVRVLSLVEDESADAFTRAMLINFLSNCVNSLEVDIVRGQVERIVGIECWHSLPEARRDAELNASQKIRRYWDYLQKKMMKQSSSESSITTHFMANLLDLFVAKLDACDDSPGAVEFCRAVIQLLINCLCQLPTRRFLIVLVDAFGIGQHARLSRTFDCSASFRKSHALLMQVMDEEIDDCTGESVCPLRRHYDRIARLQLIIFKLCKALKSKGHNSEEQILLLDKLTVFAASNVGSIDDRSSLEEVLSCLSEDDLLFVANELMLDQNRCRKIFFECILGKHERKMASLDYLNSLPLFQTEAVIWDADLVPAYDSSSITDYLHSSIPKLNLQFLTLLDYMKRNFLLFRLESTYQIRQDLESAVVRLRPKDCSAGGSNQCILGGWSRMALPIQSFTVVEVKAPLIGEKCPALVKADIELSLTIRQDVKVEWEALRRHDVCFLVCVQGANPSEDARGNERERRTPCDFVRKYGIKYVRGCEIDGMLDVDGRVIEEGNPNEEHILPAGGRRTFRVWLDANQYYLDSIGGLEDVYESFNVIVRRKPKENNFKAVLETIRTLMNTKCVVPSWLNNLILGYGDPSAACYRKLGDSSRNQDWHDTFVSRDHLLQSFPNYNVRFVDDEADSACFRLAIDDADRSVRAECYQLPITGPLTEARFGNRIPFTIAQVEAIRAGMNRGLTLIVGPPGTGKTDVAVQIIANIYRSHPEQRTLVVAHSNQALNQLFEKIIKLKVDQRHLLRLGHGERELETDHDFSRYGRVDYILQRRLDLLGQVDRLAKCLRVPGDVSYTCETASYFFLHHVVSSWERYLQACANVMGTGDEETSSTYVVNAFPFRQFFDDHLAFDRYGSAESKLDYSRACFRDIQHIFRQLQDFMAFEQVRSGAERAKYLLVKEAKIIAMTCTHAALRRKDLVDYGFKYDNILMEEAAQILEIETFIPLLLQNPDIGHLRLKRWIMIGDHNQLAPVVKNVLFQKYANMEQSLFTRFIRLGVPAIELDAQGRSRKSIARLFQWRYKNLGNLPHTELLDRNANAGFVYDFQMVNCEPLNGCGESEPMPHFFQNLSEAEYAVGLFMYMRLIGYPAERITILSTYNGQKHLIREVVRRRCHPQACPGFEFGYPHRITTVDKYQGQQNDYVILSLVRTALVGHLRDVRRLIVAVSRARLGLYILGCVDLFRNCVELAPVLNQLTQRPLRLQLVPDEQHPTDRISGEAVPASRVFEPDSLHVMLRFMHDFAAARHVEKNDVNMESDDVDSTHSAPFKRPRFDASDAGTDAIHPHVGSVMSQMLVSIVQNE